MINIPSMSKQHAANERNVARYRSAQAKKVMPLIGQLLDAWESLPNGLLFDINESTPELFKTIRLIHDGMTKP